MYIRWLNAFRGHEYNVFDSISFEMNRNGEAACEPFWFGENTSLIRTYVGHIDHISYVSIGLLINPKSVFRVFDNDIWSYYGDQTKGQNPNKLYVGHATPKKYKDHAEAWYSTTPQKCAIIGIVVYNYKYQNKTLQKNLLGIARKYKIKLYSQDDSNRIQEIKYN
jgi:hypothetical protein